jgi:hypothetical protein
LTVLPDRLAPRENEGLEKNRVFSATRGAPCKFAARLVNCRLWFDTGIGRRPFTAPARASSPAPGRIIFAAETLPRPNSPARMLVMPFATRALR